MTRQIKNILVVDDLPDWRKTLKGLLQDEGYKVEVADSWPEASGMFDQGKFDLAVIDIRLDESDEGNIDGIELASEISISQPNIKIVIITGYGTIETVERALKEKATRSKLAIDFIPKEDMDSLVEVVNQALINK